MQAGQRRHGIDSSTVSDYSPSSADWLSQTTRRSLMNSFLARILPFKSLLVALSLTIAMACDASSVNEGSGAAATEKPTVLVTGANRGIGLELARQYSAAGWQVIGTARKPAQAGELAALGVRIVQLDVTDAASVARMAEEIGTQPIDILINNAGILPVMRSLGDIAFDTFTRIIDVNTVGPARVTQALIDNLQRGQVRKIVNMTSGLGSIGNNRSGGFYGYRESKAGLNMFTKTLAAEFGPDGFICIVMDPGWVKTDMGGPNAPTRVEDSVAGIRQVVEGLTPADNGTYWTFEGEPTPW
jgi:NAD(P)-dependent dehydrogenase (short-subunit alcohol dehydrogenase family)